MLSCGSNPTVLSSTQGWEKWASWEFIISREILPTQAILYGRFHNFPKFVKKQNLAGNIVWLARKFTFFPASTVHKPMQVDPKNFNYG